MRLNLSTIIIASAFAACGVGVVNAEQVDRIRSADGDQIFVDRSGGGGGPVTLCLRTNPGMWKKDIRIDGVGTLASEQGTEDCMRIAPRFIRFEMIKAKGLGVMTGVGYGSLDLTNAGGARVTISWARD